MNILFCYWGRKGGGAKYSEELLKSFLNIDDCNVFASFSRNAENFLNINKLKVKSCHIRTYNSIISFFFMTALFPLYIIKILYFIKKNKIDIVYTPMSHIWTIILSFFLKKIQVKHVLTVHDAESHPGDLRMLQNFKRYEITQSDLIVVLSMHVRKMIVDNYQIPEKKIVQSVHGLLHYDKIQSEVKNFKENPFRIVFFGRIKKYKGLKNLLIAFIDIEKKHNNLCLEIYGQGDMKEYKNLINKIKNIKTINRWIPDEEIYSIFNTSCINIAPYIEASQSGTIPVACSCGIPTICTNVGGLKEQVANLKTGIVVNNNEVPQKIFSAIEKFYLDRKLCRVYSENCIQYSQENLKWDHISDSLYQSIKTRMP